VNGWLDRSTNEQTSQPIESIDRFSRLAECLLGWSVDQLVI